MLKTTLFLFATLNTPTALQFNDVGFASAESSLRDLLSRCGGATLTTPRCQFRAGFAKIEFLPKDHRGLLGSQSFANISSMGRGDLLRPGYSIVAPEYDCGMRWCKQRGYI